MLVLIFKVLSNNGYAYFDLKPENVVLKKINKNDN